MTFALTAAPKSTALWYLSRGTGAVALILLTATLVMGVADVTRWHSARWPRFMVDALHGTLSLAAVTLVAGHVVTSVLDPFAPLRLTDAVIPFAGRYRPLWVGLGALAFDLLLVVLVTSLVRRRIGARAWRAVHWAAYACWPLALAHTLGTGSDVRRGWMLVLSLACVGLVAIAIGARLATSGSPRARAGALAAMACGIAALALWLPRGPLGSDWARRAGTPAALLRPAVAQARPVPAGAAAPRLPIPFNTRARGTLTSGVNRDRTALVDIALRLKSPAAAILDVRLAGQPLAGGGIQVDRSQITLGPRGDPARYIGRLETLDGAKFVARLRPARGRAVRVNVVLDVGRDVAQGPVSATVRATRETAP